MSYVEICIKIIVLKIYNKIFSEKKKKKKIGSIIKCLLCNIMSDKD